MRFHLTHTARGFLLLGALLILAAPPGKGQAQAAVEPANDRCGRLAKFDLPNASVTSATAVAAGTFDGPRQAFTGADMSALYKILPAFCRIVVKATPSSDSNIGIEVWMPLDGWNGRLAGLGNGGFAGVIDDVGLAAAVAKRYAAVATDAGHTGSPADASWAFGHPEKVTDFGHRGIHEMTRVAKLVVQQFYGSNPKRSYFDGCSDGGREALMEAQRYPDDYDGIIAGAPANYWTGLLSMAPFDTQALTATPASYIPPAKIPVIDQAVLAACDKLDGVADGILNDPRQCHFDPVSIQCKAGEAAEQCLSADQVVALKTIYGGPRDSGGSSVFPGYLPGAEDGSSGWGLWITGPVPAKSAIAILSIGYFSNMVYEKRDWDYKTFTVDSGFKAAKAKTSEALDAVNPDLSAFRSRGGKLILYHGWNDPAIPAVNTVNYYQDVIGKMGQANADSFARLYMVPGMQHCGGGPGATNFGAFVGSLSNDPQRSMVIALEDWVEKGTAPNTIIASKTADGKPLGAVTMTRPLCPYPQAAKYKGSGDTNSAENFMCAGPDR
jgi:Tannase and feruloyl esterase